MSKPLLSGWYLACKEKGREKGIHRMAVLLQTREQQVEVQKPPCSAQGATFQRGGLCSLPISNAQPAYHTLAPNLISNILLSRLKSTRKQAGNKEQGFFGFGADEIIIYISLPAGLPGMRARLRPTLAAYLL